MNILGVFTFLVALATCYGERILFLGVIGSKSHKIGYMPIAEALADKGHQVTVINCFPGVQSSDNVREIFVKDISSELDIDWFQMQKESSFYKIKWIITMLHTSVYRGYQLLMENEEFRRILRERDVDLVVVDFMANDFALPIIDSLKAPFVFYTPNSATSSLYDVMGIPKEYASVPSVFLPASFNYNMTFFQRLVNMASSELFALMGRLLVDRTVDEYVKNDFPNARPVAEIKLDASLCLMNHHVTTAYPRPLPPNVIATGPLHVRPAKPLPQDLQKLADESTNGFIVFTLGSIVSGSSVPASLIQTFVQVFSKIPVRIFWKREKMSATQLPSNIVFLDWIPQQDMIAHPNCRLLISHGGLLSLQEAIYHKTPLLGLPFGTDQYSNLGRAIQEGYAIKLDWDTLNEQNLFDAITLILNEPSYRANALRVSKLMRDEMLPAKDVAAYWIEHVLRHGAKHLQVTSRNLNFFQNYLIDVWLFLGGVVFLAGISFFITLRCLCKTMRKSAKEKIH